MLNAGDNDSPSPNSTTPNIIPQDSIDSYDDDFDAQSTVSIDAQEVHNYADMDTIADDINASMNGDVEDPEIFQIFQHQFNGGILEFLCRYDTGETEWYLISLAKKYDPHSLVNYIMQNHLEKYTNTSTGNGHAYS